MRTLKRNQRKVYYANRIKTEVVKDEDGNPTGEHRVIYGTPQPLWVNVSPAKGEYLLRQFGELENYDRALTMGPLIPNGASVLWIDHDNLQTPRLPRHPNCGEPQQYSGFGQEGECRWVEGLGSVLRLRVWVLS